MVRLRHLSRVSDARHRRLPALPSGDRHRRNIGRIQPENSEAGVYEILRWSADER